MGTTRPTQPFLYVDLQKAISWKEELHARDKDGKFTSVKTGSKIVTSTGKTGTVSKVTDTHYHVNLEDGKKAKVRKGEAIHANDHKRITEAKKKGKKVAAATEKGKATKAGTKANGTGKSTPLADHSAKPAPVKGKNIAEKPKTGVAKIKENYEQLTGKKAGKTPTNELIAQANKVKRNAGVEGTDMSLNSLEKLEPKTVAVPHGNKATEDPMKDKQNQALKELDGAEATEETVTVDKMWNNAEVKKLMKKAPEKRSEADIRRLAGSITTENDKLARYVTLQMGKSRGLNLLSQVNRIGDVGQSGNGEVLNQETGYYGDLLQAARASMYETLYSVMKGSQNPKEGTAIGAHVVSRMKDKLHNDIYDIMNDIPAPHAIRGAIGDMSKAEKELQQKLGKNPTTEELANHMQENYPSFKNAPIMEAPTYDEKTGQWVATKNRVKDPTERLTMLKTYASQQKTVSADSNVGDEGEKEVTLTENVRDDQSTPDEAYEKKERQAELKDAIPKALESLGLNEKEKLVFMVMFGSPSAKTKKGNMTQDEVAEEINKMGGYEGGQQASQTWVNKYYRSALQKLIEARKTNHPALQQLQDKFMKSFFFDMIFKAMYEFELVKSLSDWGIGLDDMTTEYTRTANAPNLYSLRKSLAPYEYIGSVVTTEDGGIHARIIEFVLPESNALYKSFNASANSLKKSMFPHKGKSNHSVNSKAGEYVKANKAKYTSMSSAQHASAKAKKGGLTWSEELLIKNPGSAWITWGGKRVLVNVGDGSILYDSANEAHREEHNQGAQEDKLDFHHEKEELDRNEEERGKTTKAAWENHIKDKEAKAKKKPVDYAKEREDFAKKNRGVDFDEEGNLNFKGGSEVTEDNKHSLDHGVQAFKEQMEEMRKEWHGDGNGKIGVRKEYLQQHGHKAHNIYGELSEEERAKMDDLDENGKKAYMGNHYLNKDGVKEALQKYHDLANSGQDTEEARKEAIDALKNAGSLAANNTSAMVGDSGKSGFLEAVRKTSPSEGLDDLASALGQKELTRAKEEASKKFIPEGTYMIGNPITGKTMVVKIGYNFDGGRGGKGGKYTQAITEGFDPDGGEHEDLVSWGGLGKALGYSGNDAKRLQENLVKKANSDPDMPFMKQISEAEYNKHRGNTKLGLRETMAHKDFKLVNESRNKADEVTSRTYAQDMPDGTQNTVMVDKKGYITDPVMARLLKQKKPIDNVNDLHEVMKNAVGNRAWVTAHFGNDIHVGDALGHHIQLEYDGKGAPRVIGGKYDGYRFMDSNDIPKDAVDPATGEPIKALFKNGKLVDRKFTTKNAVAMKEGNSVMYDAGDGKYKKGRIHSIEGDTYKITDGKHHVIGMFKQDQLKPVMAEGKANSASGQAVVRLAETGVHRMKTSEAFKDNDKAKELFGQAAQKAKIGGLFDSEGNMKDDLELNDKEHAALKKLLGRSKAGRAMLEGFRSASTKDLQIHVPSSLKAQIEAEGITVGADGTAKISVGKFEQLRDVLGGMSLDHKARTYLEDHFNRKDRRPMEERMDEIVKNYQPGAVDENSAFGKAYKSQFKANSFLMDKDTGLYGAQLQGVAHLIERGRGIVGHGINLYSQVPHRRDSMINQWVNSGKR